MKRTTLTICLSFYLLFTLTINSNLYALPSKPSLFDNTKEWIGGTGNWDVPSNWSPAGVPDGFSIIKIGAGDNVTLPTGYSSNSLQVRIENGGKLTIQSGGTLNCDGAQLNGFHIQNAGSILTNNGTINIGNFVAVGGHGMVLMDAASLINNVDGKININNIPGSTAGEGVGLYTEAATITNAGKISIGATSGIRLYGIQLKVNTLFTNQSTGIIEINNITASSGLVVSDAGSLFTNNGKVEIGNLSAIKTTGIIMNNLASIINNTGATININNVNSSTPSQGTGMQITQGTFTNSGLLNIGNTALIGNLGLYIYGGQLNNLVGGTIIINRIGYREGIFAFGTGAAIDNAGTIKIGNTNTVVAVGIFLNTTAQFTNQSTGLVEIGNIPGTSDGVGILLNNKGTVFTNNGTVNCGYTGASIGKTGILLNGSALFLNNADATLNINNIIGTTGSNVAGITINTSSVVTNIGTINIGVDVAITKSGLLMNDGGLFNNQEGADLKIGTINSFGAIAATGTKTTITNEGNIIMGDFGSIKGGGLSIVGASKLINTGTGLIEIHNITNGHGISMITSGTSLTNDGTINIGKRSTLDGGFGINQQTGSVLTNGQTGMITINNITEDGSNKGFGYYAKGIGVICTNSGSINIGNTASISRIGMFIGSTAQLTNESGATIQVNRVNTLDGVRMEVSGKIFNNGTFHIGNTNAINEKGLAILSAAEFTNNAGGTLSINRNSTLDGIFVSGANSKFINSGTTSIGDLAPGSFSGIASESGAIVSNNGTINFGKFLNYGVGPNTDLQNNNGGILQTATGGVLRNDGTITNSDGGIIRNTSLLINNGTISLAHANAKIENNTGATFTNNGLLKGIGTIVQSGTFDNTTGSVIQPGLSPGTLSVTGDFNLGNATLQMEVDGTGAGTFDFLNISGNATLSNATLNVTTSFTPLNGQSVTLLNSSGLTGIFATATSPEWQVNYNNPSPGQVTLSFGSPVPLTLLSFSGTQLNNDAILKWKTTNEINVSHFEIQRSEDGQLFNKEGTVLSGSINYSWTDISVFNNKQMVFYRIKSIDNDGRFTYSNIIRLINNSSNQISVFPNPVKDFVTLSGLQQNGMIFLFTTEGKLLKRITVNAQRVTLDMSTYTKGNYLLQYKHNGVVINQKIVKQ